MMRTGDQLQKEIEKVFSGKPWYGLPIYHIIGKVNFEAAFEKPQHNVHSIAEILPHIISWTQEVSRRMQGSAAGVPKGGDWPDTGKADEQKWQTWVNDLKLANVNLIGIIQVFPDSNWNNLINDTRGTEPVTSFKGLIEGFIQHQIYHAGQIAILNKIING